jgi:hypothetical protein
MDRVFILYDDRAADGEGTEDAAVLVTCESNTEALGYRGEFGAMACYSYFDEQNDLVDERFEWNWFPGNPTKGPWPH